MGNPENLLKNKTAMEKLLLTLKYIPLFSLTAFFRVGTGVPKVGSYKCLHMYGKKCVRWRVLQLSRVSNE